MLWNAPSGLSRFDEAVRAKRPNYATTLNDFQSSADHAFHTLKAKYYRLADLVAEMRVAPAA